MKALYLINRFQPAVDGWFLLVPQGEHPWTSEDGKERLIQVVDDKAVESMVNRFKADGVELMIDADHLSHDRTQKSEAYGWIDDVKNRNGDLWAHAAWTDLGDPAVKSRRYRFISPVIPRDGVEDLGNGRVRLLQLSDAGLTNQPNMPVPPLTNRAEQDAWLKNAGTSEGAHKGWETRRAGGGSAPKEKTRSKSTGTKKAARKKKIVQRDKPTKAEEAAQFKRKPASKASLREAKAYQKSQLPPPPPPKPPAPPAPPKPPKAARKSRISAQDKAALKKLAPGDLATIAASKGISKAAARKSFLATGREMNAPKISQTGASEIKPGSAVRASKAGAISTGKDGGKLALDKQGNPDWKRTIRLNAPKKSSYEVRAAKAAAARRLKNNHFSSTPPSGHRAARKTGLPDYFGTASN